VSENSNAIQEKILLLSESEEYIFRNALQEKKVYDRPYPCTMDSIDILQDITSFFRMMMFMPKCDTKRIKARLTIDLQDAFAQSQILDPKVRSSELRQEDYLDQIPRVTESIWGIFGRHCIHSNTNLKTIANYFTTLLDQPVVLSSPIVRLTDAFTQDAQEIWEASCIEYVNLNNLKRVQSTIHVMQNSTEKFSVTIIFDGIKYNRIQVQASCNLSPKTVYKCWDEAVRQFLVQNCVSFEIKVGDLE